MSSSDIHLVERVSEGKAQPKGYSRRQRFQGGFLTLDEVRTGVQQSPVAPEREELPHECSVENSRRAGGKECVVDRIDRSGKDHRTATCSAIHVEGKLGLKWRN